MRLNELPYHQNMAIYILKLLFIGAFLLIVFSSDVLGSSTNEYWDATNAGCTPGSRHGTCSLDECVNCGGGCEPSNAVYSNNWLCYKGKWDKCDPASEGSRLGEWNCIGGNWVKTTEPVCSDRTNDYWDTSYFDCTPGSVHGTCSLDECVACTGACYLSDSIPFFEGSASGYWLCYEGKWDKCDPESQGVTRGKWLCNEGNWVPVPPASDTPVSCTANASAELRYIGFGEYDVVSRFDHRPDGIGDGHFHLTINIPGTHTLTYLKLETVDRNNEPISGQIWDTRSYWILGVHRSDTSEMLNLADQNISLVITNQETFDLYADDSGYFEPFQRFLVTAIFEDGCIAQASTAIDEYCTVNASAELRYVDFGKDVVGISTHKPDGTGDGHFRLTIKIPGTHILSNIKLETVDSNNEPVFGQVWDTKHGGYWILGIHQSDTSEVLNPADQIIGPIIVTNQKTFDLYAEDSGFFNPLQRFLVTAVFADGCAVRASTVIDSVSEEKMEAITLAIRPSPSVSANVEALSIRPGETKDVIFTVTNEGADSDIESYLSVSVSPGLHIKEYKCSSDEMRFKHSQVGSKIWTSDNLQMNSEHELLDAYKAYASGESNTITVTIKPTFDEAAEAGQQWIRYRAAFDTIGEDYDYDYDYVRNPTSGPKDQQGWPVYEIPVTVETLEPEGVISGYVYGDFGGLGENPLEGAKFYCQEGTSGDPIPVTENNGYYELLQKFYPLTEYRITCEKPNHRLGIQTLKTDKSGNAEFEFHLVFETPRSGDSDKDGLSDDIEVKANTDPNDIDSDNDDLTDGEELNGCYVGRRIVDIYEDGSRKPYKISDIIEWCQFRSDFNGDGIRDRNFGSIGLDDYLERDADGDRDCDLDDEALIFYINPSWVKTDPLCSDTDGDKIADNEDPFPTTFITKWEICVKGIENLYEVQKYYGDDLSVKRALEIWYRDGYSVTTGIGQSNIKDPEKVEGYYSYDYDFDGISDCVEEYFKIQKPGIERTQQVGSTYSSYNKDGYDSDGDGFTDLEEIMSGENPNIYIFPKKNLAFAQLSLTSGEGIDASCTCYIDLDDMYFISEDGKADWITLWYVGSLGISASVLPCIDGGFTQIPVKDGVEEDTHDFSSECGVQLLVLDTGGAFHINPGFGLSCGTQICKFDIARSKFEEAGLRSIDPINKIFDIIRLPEFVNDIEDAINCITSENRYPDGYRDAEINGIGP